MKIHYALYDAATSVSGGHYWNWFDDTLSLDDLRQFFEIAREHRPDNTNDLQPDDLWGGIVRLKEWTVLYRVLDGGRDGKDRPGRYVLLSAWIHSKETEGINLFPVFDRPTFQKIADTAKKLPVPPPEVLSEEFAGERPKQRIELPDTEVRKTLADKLALDVMNLFGAIPLDRSASVKFIRTQSECKAELEVGSAPVAKSPAAEKSITPTPQPTTDMLLEELTKRNKQLQSELAISQQKIWTEQATSEQTQQRFKAELAKVKAELAEANRQKKILEKQSALWRTGSLAISVLLFLTVVLYVFDGFQYW
ncbi:MAG: hypothetical protein LBT89_06820 [Planctomycetaceae bacterium]|jgi:hypothetical protein|nr:hypothetical protein [Planctomycetaceae bacterium]